MLNHLQTMAFHNIVPAINGPFTWSTHFEPSPADDALYTLLGLGFVWLFSYHSSWGTSQATEPKDPSRSFLTQWRERSIPNRVWTGGFAALFLINSHLTKEASWLWHLCGVIVGMILTEIIIEVLSLLAPWAESLARRITTFDESSDDVVENEKKGILSGKRSIEDIRRSFEGRVHQIHHLLCMAGLLCVWVTVSLLFSAIPNPIAGEWKRFYIYPLYTPLFTPFVFQRRIRDQYSESDRHYKPADEAEPRFGIQCTAIESILLFCRRFLALRAMAAFYDAAMETILGAPVTYSLLSWMLRTPLIILLGIFACPIVLHQEAVNMWCTVHHQKWIDCGCHDDWRRGVDKLDVSDELAVAEVKDSKLLLP